MEDPPKNPASALRRSLDTLDRDGYAWVPGLLSKPESDELSALYEDPRSFRKTVVMARHGFGSGEYKYFTYPLPDRVAALREQLYPALASIANRWHDLLGLTARFPDQLASFTELCHASGQTQPTPLMLEYRAGDYNRLHQDLYGECIFPLQVVIQLSSPGSDFSGGEFVLTEQRPRMQSRPIVLTPERGDAIIFPVYQRPARSMRGYHRAQMRHGVSAVRSGHRRTLGIIFHDAAS